MKKFLKNGNWGLKLLALILAILLYQLLKNETGRLTDRNQDDTRILKRP